MTALALTVFAASLLGSLHCAGMCGGLVAFYSGGQRGGRLAPHLAYNAGRLAAYATLGGIAGALGAALDATGAWLGIQRVAAALAGALIVLWGVAALGESLGVRVPRPGAPAALRGLVSRGIARIAGRAPATRALVIGLLTGCLPCGWLYAFVVTAAGTGNALAGAMVMALFWMGTLPVMLSLGLGIAAITGPLRRHLPAACAVAMIVVGLIAVAGRLRPVDPPARASSAENAVMSRSAHEHR